MLDMVSEIKEELSEEYRKGIERKIIDQVKEGVHHLINGHKLTSEYDPRIEKYIYEIHSELKNQINEEVICSTIGDEIKPLENESCSVIERKVVLVKEWLNIEYTELLESPEKTKFYHSIIGMIYGNFHELFEDGDGKEIKEEYAELREAAERLKDELDRIDEQHMSDLRTYSLELIEEMKSQDWEDEIKGNFRDHLLKKFAVSTLYNDEAREILRKLDETYAMSISHPTRIFTDPEKAEMALLGDDFVKYDETLKLRAKNEPKMYQSFISFIESNYKQKNPFKRNENAKRRYYPGPKFIMKERYNDKPIAKWIETFMVEEYGKGARVSKKCSDDITNDFILRYVRENNFYSEVFYF